MTYMKDYSFTILKARLYPGYEQYLRPGDVLRIPVDTSMFRDTFQCEFEVTSMNLILSFDCQPMISPCKHYFKWDYVPAPFYMTIKPLHPEHPQLFTQLFNSYPFRLVGVSKDGDWTVAAAISAVGSQKLKEGRDLTTLTI